MRICIRALHTHALHARPSESPLPPPPRDSDRGTLLDGTLFDKADEFTFELGAGDVIKGWDKGVAGMRVGEKVKLTVPPKMGYGKRGSPPEIPPDATLLFEVTLKRIE